MDVLWTIVIGFVVGLIARVVKPGDDGFGGIVLTTILGILGAFVASFLGQFIGIYQPGEKAGFIGAIVGAVIVLWVWGSVRNRRKA